MSLLEGKIVYLDQKGWIDLAKSNKGIMEVVMRASEAGAAVFPLSIVHLAETNSISNPQRRERLASLMVPMSKGYCFSPYVEPIIGSEIRNAILRSLGIPTMDLKKYVLKKGISHLVGAKPEIIPKEGGLKPPPEIGQKLLDLLDSPEAMYIALTAHPRRYKKHSLSIQRGNIEAVKKMEHIRQEQLKIKDNNLRRRVALVSFMMEIMAPKLAKMLVEMNLPKDTVIKKGWSRRDFKEFLNSHPTALCLFTLLLERDQQLQRLIEVNDLYDVWALSLAIPYSDIVVTEKMWTSITRQTKLDKICNTTILSSVDELIGHL
ncbi:MAG: hypothetical protein ACE5HG_03715 [Candidatus Bathyarchaeia archaeon]